MSMHGRIQSAVSDRELIDAAIAEGRVTVCPPGRGVGEAAHRPLPTPEAADPERPVGPPAREVRRMGVRAALEWAFGVEHARLAYGSLGGQGLPGFGTEFLLLERGMLGQQVDVSPGRSLPADDAELIADAVQNALPPLSAFRLADMARAGLMPWSGEVAPRLEPRDWVCGRAGKWRGRTADARQLGAEGWPLMERVNRLGRRVREPVKYTPCRLTVTAQQIARKRREHLDWWSDLLTVRTALQGVDLRWIEITSEMPPLTPWRKGS